MKTNRREILGAAVGTIGAMAAVASKDAIAANAKNITRIAFGSCAKQSKEQPIWNAIGETNPDLFIFLGDNIYGDTRDPEVMREKYKMLAAKPEFKKFRDKVPFLTIWDDHDYGEDDAGSEYPMKDESRKQFCDFWNIAKDSPRRTREDGIYTSHIINSAGHKLQIILPDLRWNRTPIVKKDIGEKDYKTWATELHAANKPVVGPYERNPDLKATMLGAKQWKWLEGELAKPADARIIGSSLQFLADFAGWEGWINYYQDHQKMLETIRKKRANGLVFISGDTHYAEISRLETNVPYPIWDITSSGITEVWPVLPPNSLRIGDAYRDRNFGILEFHWDKKIIKAEIRGEDGSLKIEQSIPLSSLTI